MGKGVRMRYAALLALLLSGCGTATGVYNRTANPDNVIHNYEYFHDAHENIEAKQRNITGHRALIQTETDAAEIRRLRMELTAIQMSCRDLVAKYNANSNKANRSIFMGNSLPDNVNLSVCE